MSLRTSGWKGPQGSPTGVSSKNTNADIYQPYIFVEHLAQRSLLAYRIPAFQMFHKNAKILAFARRKRMT